MNLPNDERSAQRRRLRIASFAAHASRGLVRDQTMRRKAMFWVVILAVLLLFCGATFFAPWLDPKVRPGWFLLYWLICAWVTVTALLLAIFDLLLVRVQARQTKRQLAQKLAETRDDSD